MFVKKLPWFEDVCKESTYLGLRMIVKKLPWVEGIFNLGYLGSSVFYNTLLLVPWVDCVGDIIEGHQLRNRIPESNPGHLRHKKVDSTTRSLTSKTFINQL